MNEKQNLNNIEAQIPTISDAFFLCECSSEILLFTRFIDEHGGQIYVSIYTIGQFHKKPNIWQRLKYCWHHITTGKIHEDQVILSFEKAQQISEWLHINAKVDTNR